MCASIDREINVKMYLILVWNGEKKKAWALRSKRPKTVTCYLGETRQLLKSQNLSFCVYKTKLSNDNHKLVVELGITLSVLAASESSSRTKITCLRVNIPGTQI